MPDPEKTRQPERARILVVDDEPAMGVALRRILGRKYEMEHLVSATEALSRIRAGARFDVILSDLMMPQMTGMDLHAALSREFPELVQRVVFFTGGAFTQAGQAFLSQVPNRRIDKPFEATTVEEVIEQTLQATAPQR
jgi:CheY-like chemotaxis protein